MISKIIKNKLWHLLKEKEISFAMIYDRNGRILWHQGEGMGVETIDSRKILLPIKDLIIHRLNSNYFLYIEGDKKHPFINLDSKTLKVTNETLPDMVVQIEKNEKDVEDICGKSEKMKTVRELLLKYSKEDEPVLLLGETGVGKNHAAELIHHYSGRRGKCVVVDAPTLQENLFESTLFGHKRGAFTDAKFDRKGLVEEATAGTLFIDEISEVPVFLQAKLLRFIELKKYRVLGESFEREADVRVIAASNKCLFNALKNKEFREDLYYRLNIFEITIPPLRERKEDIETFVNEKRSYLRGKQIDKGFMEVLYNHDWPGNFRELITVLKRAGVCSQNPITAIDIQNIINQSTWNKSPDRQRDKIDQIWDAIKSGGNFWEVVKSPFLARDLNRFEVKEIINLGLAQAYGKYKNLIKVFNLNDKDYHKFMTFLREYRLR